MTTLTIECPGCQQAFEVSEELQGRTVECGSCENRFQVTEEVMATHQDRVYPDEVKKDVDLSRFGRVPAKAGPVEFRTMEYDKSVNQTFVGPIPPVRVFAAVGGLLILAATALALYFGSQPESSLLQDVEVPQRLALAGFMSLVAFGLLVWGMVKSRIGGILLGLLGATGLLALANYMPVYRTATVTDGSVRSVSEEEPEGAIAPDSPFFPGISEEPLTPQEVMSKTRWNASVLPLVSRADETQVAAIWVRSMEEFHNLQIRSYLQQEFDLPIRPDFRELRDGGLFVMSGVPLDLDRVEFSVERFGEVEQVIPELRLIQMQVNPMVLGEVSNELTAKLNNSQDGAFFSLNYAELIALDRTRVKEAIIRLANAKPLRMRKDITVRLVGLLSGDLDTETVGYIADALKVWSEEGDGADRILAELATNMKSSGKEVPDEIIRFLAERQTPSAATVMVELWAMDTTSRQRYLESYGSAAAPYVTPYLRSASPGLVRAAARLLGRIGTSAELPAMREALASVRGEENRLVLQEAIAKVSQQ